MQFSYFWVKLLGNGRIPGLSSSLHLLRIANFENLYENFFLGKIQTFAWIDCLLFSIFFFTHSIRLYHFRAQEFYCPQYSNDIQYCALSVRISTNSPNCLTHHALLTMPIINKRHAHWGEKQTSNKTAKEGKKPLHTTV